MSLKSAVILVAALLLGLSAADVLAQDTDAEVRTWSGRSLRLSQVSFEIRYTILVPGGGGPALGGGALGGGPPGGVAAGVYAPGLGGGMGGFGGGGGPGSLSIGNLQGFRQFTSAPDPIQGRRLVDYLNVYQEGVTYRLAVNRIASIAFRRQPVRNSTLPPYVAPEHIYSAAKVTFTDGSTLDGDNVNPGTLLLRGSTPEGRVEIPWQEIETVRFNR
jgi:hypothetical protein